MSINFSVEQSDGKARLGRLETTHGVVETPLFMPVGTQATVKGLTPDQLHSAGATMLLANTYHLTLRPGEELIAELGGLHRFMGWDGPILTDSGGYQVYSLALSCRITDRAAIFQSHIDGTLLELSPEKAVSIQDDSDGRPLTLRVIVVIKADTTTTLVISRAKTEKETHIAWSHYRRFDG